jgi:chloramphenicol O-acetyltransferase type B
MTIFKNYRESIIIKDHVKSKHIIAGDHSYYSGYYHGKPFEECVMYLDEADNAVDPENIDCLFIGKFCSIATGAKFMMCGTQGHNYNWIAVHPLAGFDDAFFPGHSWKGDTVIGNDVWIGAEALIMPGMQIADGAVIASRSVVTKNVGPYEIWGGNPARLIKKRFSDDDIEKLLEIKWWDWDLETLKRNLHHLRSADVAVLWEKFKKITL